MAKFLSKVKTYLLLLLFFLEENLRSDRIILNVGSFSKNFVWGIGSCFSAWVGVRDRSRSFEICNCTLLAYFLGILTSSFLTCFLFFFF